MDWINSVDTRTYGELIFKGSIVIDEESDEGFEDQGVDSDEYE